MGRSYKNICRKALQCDVRKDGNEMRRCVNPGKRGYGKEIKTFIEKQAQRGKTNKEIALLLNKRFPEYQFTTTKVRKYIYRHDIVRVEAPKYTLTQKEKEFAEKNHNVVYDFLHKNRLGIDEWYDVVIFGYLNAVKRYNREAKLKQYKFTTVAWTRMFCEVSNRKTYNNALMRRAETISIELIATESGRSLDEVIPDCKAEETYREVEFRKDTEQHIMSCLTRGQQAQFYLAYLGYEPEEILDIIGISMDEQQKNMNHIRAVVVGNM